ncbi:hypothetical protein Lesp02_26600 [Lentzea sp. NBRC 105346]|uniref:hypothetical protein n=1 Tax=Lentzea sp. NBRC 105346 TaxID=3032205 RepID=UPI002556DF52|nr:hypothetical protein [Lentzea sp. NBRC 105346]GLZ30471.1 hypothetical protein Lesp02_26600 [Lentzea sp. NBRC 105346]
MAIIETDPRVQAMFDENTVATRRANTEVSETLKADQARLAADAKEREERFATAKAELAAEAEELGKKGAEPRKPQWEHRDRSAGEMSFGMEEEDEPVRATPPPPPPVAPPVAPPVSRPAPRRPAPRDDDDDDLSGQTWLS